MISCSGLKIFAFLPSYSCLLLACPHNYIWHLIEVEEDEQPDVAISLMPCGLFKTSLTFKTLLHSFYTAKIHHRWYDGNLVPDVFMLVG